MKEYHTVIIADDHGGVRKGIKRLLEKNGEFEVIGLAKDGKEAVQLVRQEEPDLLILDVKLPILRGEEVAYRLTKTTPDVRILAISSFDSPQYILGMLENGARGYLTKEEAPVLLRKAARDILLKDATQWISEKLKQRTGITFTKDENKVLHLSATEKQIVALLKDGRTETEIARKLTFSTSRIKRFIQILLMKYEVTSVEALMEVA